MIRVVDAIGTELTSEQVVGVVAAASGAWTPRVRRKLFYPYFWFELRYAVGTFLGKSALRVSCLVDTRTKVASTADPFQLDQAEADASNVVEPRVDEDEARRIAERYAAYVVRNKRKALAIPKMEVLERKLIYKPFWIVDCTKPPESGFSVLVDGVTGTFLPLPQGGRGRLAERSG